MEHEQAFCYKSTSHLENLAYSFQEATSIFMLIHIETSGIIV